jgi:hypothetical protein
MPNNSDTVEACSIQRVPVSIKQIYPTAENAGAAILMLGAKQ